MDLIEYLKQLNQQAEANANQSNGQVKDAISHSMDKIAMANPEVQGPHLAPDADKQFDNNQLGAVMGSVSPVNQLSATGAAKALGLTAGEEAANAIGRSVKAPQTQIELAREAAAKGRAAYSGDVNRFQRLQNILKRD